MAPWNQPIDQTVASIWNQLTADEQVEVTEAFGIHPHDQQEP